MQHADVPGIHGQAKIERPCKRINSRMSAEKVCTVEERGTLELCNRPY